MHKRLTVKLCFIALLAFAVINPQMALSSGAITSCTGIPCSRTVIGGPALCGGFCYCQSYSWFDATGFFALSVAPFFCLNGQSVTNEAHVIEQSAGEGILPDGVIAPGDGYLTASLGRTVGTSFGEISCNEFVPLMSVSYSWNQVNCQAYTGTPRLGGEDPGCDDGSTCSEEGYCDNGTECEGGSCDDGSACNDGLCFDGSACNNSEADGNTSCLCGDGTTDPSCCEGGSNYSDCSYCFDNYLTDPACNGGQYSGYCPDYSN